MGKPFSDASIEGKFADLATRGLIHPGRVRYWVCRDDQHGDAPVALLRLIPPSNPATLAAYEVLYQHAAKADGWTPNDDLGAKVQFLGADDWDQISSAEAERLARVWGAEPSSH